MWETKYLSSKYKHVQGYTSKSGKVYWVVAMKGVSKAHLKTEREAAIAVDKILINRGKLPVNILKCK